MKLFILHLQAHPVPLHAYAAMLAIVLGAVQLAMPKGTVSHKWLGYTWVLLILIVSISSFFINEIRTIGPFSWIHLLSVFTIWSVYDSVKAATQGNIKKHKQGMVRLYVLALIITGLFTLLPGRTMHAVVFG